VFLRLRRRGRACDFGASGYSTRRFEPPCDNSRILGLQMDDYGCVYQTLKADLFTAINMLVVRSHEIAPSIWHKRRINAPAPSHACSLSKLAL